MRAMLSAADPKKSMHNGSVQDDDMIDLPIPVDVSQVSRAERVQLVIRKATPGLQLKNTLIPQIALSSEINNT